MLLSVHPHATASDEVVLFIPPDCVEQEDSCRVALFHLEEYETAKEAFEAGQALDPKNSSFKTWIRKCAAEIDGRHLPQWPLTALF